MPLLMGNWTLFLDGAQGTLALGNMDSTGRFTVSVSRPALNTFIGP